MEKIFGKRTFDRDIEREKEEKDEAIKSAERKKQKAKKIQKAAEDKEKAARNVRSPNGKVREETALENKKEEPTAKSEE